MKKALGKVRWADAEDSELRTFLKELEAEKKKKEEKANMIADVFGTDYGYADYV